MEFDQETGEPIPGSPTITVTGVQNAVPLVVDTPNVIATEATPPVAEATPAVPAAPAVATPAAPAAPVAVDVPTQLAELATSLGFSPSDFEGFESVEQARSAATQYLANLSNAPPIVDNTPRRDTPPVAPVVPEVSAPAAVTIDLKALEIDESDPVAKVVKALEGELNKAHAAIKGLTERQEAEAKAVVEARKQQTLQTAEAKVNSFASVRYGVTGRRNMFQQSNLERLFNLADGLYLSEKARNGFCSTPLEARLEMARALDEGKAFAPASTPNVATTPTPAIPGAVNLNTPAVVEELSFYEQWSAKPELRAALGIRD